MEFVHFLDFRTSTLPFPSFCNTNPSVADEIGFLGRTLTFFGQLDSTVPSFSPLGGAFPDSGSPADLL